MDYSMNNNSKVITWCIYIHTNKLNGKVYIGKTCKNPKYRWNDGKGYKSQPYFWNAIQKYGWDGFHHEIFVEGLDEAEANELEIQLIKTYNSMNPEKGYNQTAGGEGMLGWHHSAESIQKIILSNQMRGVTEETKMKQREAHKGRYIKEKNPFWGKTHTEETKIKISVANTGKSHVITEETRKKISNSRQGKYSGENSPWYGKKHTEEQKRKIGIASKVYQNLPEVKALKSEKIKGEKNPMYGKLPTTAKAVYQYDKAGMCIAEYPSAMHAKRATGISNISIGECCKGHLKSAGGFIWKYKT